MKRVAAGIAVAVLFHAAVLLFGGIFFLKPDPPPAVAKVEEVDLVEHDDQDDQDEDAKKQEEPEAGREAVERDEPIEVPTEMPDPRELAKLDAEAAAPRLDAVSLGALEDLLAPGAGAAGTGDFTTGSADLAAGGRIGGTGGAARADLESIFAITDLDQRPTPVFQSPPAYPFELRRKKVEGTVSVAFVVDEEGRVIDPRVEKSTDPGFEKSALDAVRQWKFEPAVRGGRKVKCKMRVPLRFSVS